MSGTLSHWSTTANDSSHPTIPRWDYKLYAAVEQGLREGYVVYPLLFNIFVAVVLTVAHKIISEDTVILAELVDLKE